MVVWGYLTEQEVLVKNILKNVKFSLVEVTFYWYGGLDEATLRREDRHYWSYGLPKHAQIFHKHIDVRNGFVGVEDSSQQSSSLVLEKETERKFVFDMQTFHMIGDEDEVLGCKLY